jgi:glycosyl transferase family 2
MNNDKIVLLTLPSDQGDVLKDYIEWHLGLGVDLIIAQDCWSSDNTHEILNLYASRGQLEWFPMPQRDISKYSPSDTLAKMAIDRHAEWMIMTDVDEFLCPTGDDLRTSLQRAAADNVSSLRVPCFNMTDRIPTPSMRATEALTLRIDRPAVVTDEHWRSGELPVPYVFMGHPPKTIVRAPAFVAYGPGTHTVTTAWGAMRELSDLRILHYPFRGWSTFQTKVANAVAFFEDNTHLEPWWSWHWRRWIRLNQEGQLREEYESQFLSPARAQQLIRDGVCTVDETIANWIRESDAVRKAETCT